MVECVGWPRVWPSGGFFLSPDGLISNLKITRFFNGLLDRKLLRREHLQGNAFARRLARLMMNASAGQDDISRYLARVRRDQHSGRITLFIDGLDHAFGDPSVPTMLAELFSSEQWRRCPVWITGRPYAFNTCWKELFAQTNAWQFLRVEPLKEGDIRRYLSWWMEAFRNLDINWYERNSMGGRELLRVPRFMQLIAEILYRTVSSAVAQHEDLRAALNALHLETKADVYYQAYFHVGNYSDLDSRGLLGQGLVGVAESLGLYDEDPDQDNYPERVQRAGVLLAALAFELYNWKQKPKPAPVDGVSAKDRGLLKERVARRLAKTRKGTRKWFLADFKLLTKMNNRTVDFLLFRHVGKNGIVFHDRTVQAFFAAYWAMNFATMEKDFPIMEKWKVVLDQKGKRSKDIDEFWQFAAEMPKVDYERWLRMFKPCYRPPQGLGGEHEWVQWHRRMIYRSYESMKTRSPQTVDDWKASYLALEQGTAEQQRIYSEIEEGLRANASQTA